MIRFIAMILVAAVSSGAMAAEWSTTPMQMVAENATPSPVHSGATMPYPSPYVAPTPVAVPAQPLPQQDSAADAGEAQLHRMNF